MAINIPDSNSVARDFSQAMITVMTQKIASERDAKNREMQAQHNSDMLGIEKQKVAGQAEQNKLMMEMAVNQFNQQKAESDRSFNMQKTLFDKANMSVADKHQQNIDNASALGFSQSELGNEKGAWNGYSMDDILKTFSGHITTGAGIGAGAGTALGLGSSAGVFSPPLAVAGGTVGGLSGAATALASLAFTPKKDTEEAKAKRAELMVALMQLEGNQTGAGLSYLGK